jgi:hypothetical protein
VEDYSSQKKFQFPKRAKNGGSILIWDLSDISETKKSNLLQLYYGCKKKEKEGLAWDLGQRRSSIDVIFDCIYMSPAGSL